MPVESRNVRPGPDARSVKTEEGELLNVPSDWDLLPPGDAGVTRRVKSRGPSWTVKQKKGRRMFSLGVWAPAETIEAVKREFEVERATPAYAKRKLADAKRRKVKEQAYVEDFHAAVVAFLNFPDRHRELAQKIAAAVTTHATPVGSGTVARTKRIPIERRAESAVIAWMRHQTTAYDDMKIPRIKGKRRELRRMLAAQSRKLLDVYRSGTDLQTGADLKSESCPLQRAVNS